MSSPYLILLAEGHVRFRHEVKKIINRTDGIKVVGEVATGQALFDFLERTTPHLLILDIALPLLRSLEATKKIRGKYPGVKVLILVTDWNQEYLDRSLSAGASGCILKQNVDVELCKAIETVRRGGVYLPHNFAGATLSQPQFVCP